MSEFGFNKKERMVSTIDIERLFSSGSRSLSIYPVRAVFRRTDGGEEPLMVLISVSKRHFKHAVDRNRAKRQMREAYRLHRQTLRGALTDKGQKMHLAFIWMADKPQPSAAVEKSIVHLLELISERL